MDLWTISIAIYGAVVATGALALEVRRWFESGPRLSINVMPEATMVNVPGTEGQTWLFASVTNRGNAPTTITHFVLIDYGTWLGHLRSKPIWTGIVLQPHPAAALPTLPKTGGPGEIWQGVALWDEELKALIDAGYLYLAIYASRTDKPTYKRVRISAKPPADAEQI